MGSAGMNELMQRFASSVGGRGVDEKRVSIVSFEIHTSTGQRNERRLAGRLHFIHGAWMQTINTDAPCQVHCIHS